MWVDPMRIQNTIKSLGKKDNITSTSKWVQRCEKKKCTTKISVEDPDPHHLAGSGILEADPDPGL
jgi:hypothetical protein